MNERERWIVYPLLFLALGVALRDKLVDRTTTKSIVCEELAIVDSSSGQVLVKLGRAEPHPGVPPTGIVMVDGVLETREFIWQRMPVLPIQVSPGVAVLGVLQGVAQAGAKLPNLNAPSVASAGAAQTVDKWLAAEAESRAATIASRRRHF